LSAVRLEATSGRRPGRVAPWAVRVALAHVGAPSSVESIAWYRREKTVDSEGIGIELEQPARAMGATSPEPQSKSEAINADRFKVVADTLVAEAGVTPLLHAVAVDTVMDGSGIQGVIVHSKSRRGVILAKRVVDASGDADVVHHAGAPYRKTPRASSRPA
jgi:hypothetical protein